MKVEDLSNVYNNTNTKNITTALKTIKQLYGNSLFETLLKDILNQDMGGLAQSIRIYTVDPNKNWGDYAVQRDIQGRNNALSRLYDTVSNANRYNSPEDKCEDCGKVGSDVFSRKGSDRKLCMSCYSKLVPSVNIPPEILKGVKTSYGGYVNDDELYGPGGILNFDNSKEDDEVKI